nr:hypothetical protein [Actinomycetota bacterium]
MIKTAMAVGTAGVLALVCAMPAMAQAPAARPQPARVKGPMWPFGFQGGVERGRPLLGAVLPDPVEQRLVHPGRLDRADPL